MTGTLVSYLIHQELNVSLSFHLFCLNDAEINQFLSPDYSVSNTPFLLIQTVRGTRRNTFLPQTVIKRDFVGREDVLKYAIDICNGHKAISFLPEKKYASTDVNSCSGRV